jgi:DNA repair ATPase RecN
MMTARWSTRQATGSFWMPMAACRAWLVTSQRLLLAYRAAEKERDDSTLPRSLKPRKEADYLKASVEELTALSPEPGEEEALAARRTLMMQAEKVAADVQEAHEAVSGGPRHRLFWRL